MPVRIDLESEEGPEGERRAEALPLLVAIVLLLLSPLLYDVISLVRR